MPKHIHYALLLSFVLPLVVSAQTPQAERARSFPLAYFSAKRAFAESDDGKAAQVKLSSIRAAKALELDARNMKLKDLQRALDESSSFLDVRARSQREREIGKVETDLQWFLEEAQAEVQYVQRQLEIAFEAKLRPILDSVAHERGLLLVLDQDAGHIAWSADTLDITAEVVNRVNKR